MKVLQFPHPKMERRKPENRLERATIEAEQLEERQIELWLSVADAAFDNSWERPELKTAS